MTSKFPKIATNSDSLSSNATAVVPTCVRAITSHFNKDARTWIAIALSRCRSLGRAHLRTRSDAWHHCNTGQNTRGISETLRPEP